jgi:hypothetical protein
MPGGFLYNGKTLALLSEFESRQSLEAASATRWPLNPFENPEASEAK